jgi:hypothetical protein
MCPVSWRAVTDAAVPALITSREVVRALLEGEQVVDLRPDAGEVRPGSRFWLSPAAGMSPELKPAYRLARELSSAEEESAAGQVRIGGWAELAATATTRLDPERIAALDSKTVLALDRLAEDLGGGDVRVLVLRVHRLLEPVTVATDLTGLPDDPATSPSEPALSDVAFDARLKGVEGALPGRLTRA